MILKIDNLRKGLTRLLLSGIFMLCLASGLYAGESKKTAVFLSDTIKPYYEAAQGIEAQLNEEQIDSKLVDVKDLTDEEFKTKCRTLISDGYHYWIGIGPLATERIYASAFPQIKGRIFSMVLAPRNIVEKEQALCGVSLNIPVKRQVEELVRVFSSGIRPGLIYDPAYNSEFADQAYHYFQENGLTLELLKVNSRTDVRDVISSKIRKINLLWMIPDRTVISESLIRYIIKNSMKQGVGVAGYNRYFLKRGAAAAFVINYEKVGRQTAQILTGMIDEKECESLEPEFELNMNTKLIKLLDLNKKP